MSVDHEVSLESIERAMTSLRSQLTRQVLNRFRRFLGLVSRLPHNDACEDVQNVRSSYDRHKTITKLLHNRESMIKVLFLRKS